VSPSAATKKPSSQARCSGVKGALSGSSESFGGRGLWVIATYASSFMPKHRSKYRNKYNPLNGVGLLCPARTGCTVRKSCASQSGRKSVQGNEENDDLTDLLKRAEHIAGLAADLRGAQPRNQPDCGSEQEQR
jgi:hypothetical protein